MVTQREFAYLFTREITYIHVYIYIYTEILTYYDIDDIEEFVYRLAINL